MKSPVLPPALEGERMQFGGSTGAITAYSAGEGPPLLLMHSVNAAVKRILVGPGRGAPLFRGLTTPGVIRCFLRRAWGAQDIDEALWAYDVLTTRQPGAEHAPLAFLSAALFSSDVNTLYEQSWRSRCG